MPRRRKESRALQWTVYILVRTLLCIVQALPLSWCYRIADFIAWLALRLDRRHTQVALDNLRAAFPGRFSDDELLTIVRQVYRHFAAIVVDIAFIVRKLHERNWRKHIRLEGHEPVVDLLLSDRPVILQSGHFGNWEIAGYVFGLFGFVPYSVARTLDNPYLERLLRSFRVRTGQRIIYKRGAYEKVEAVMRRGGTIALLNDQDAGARGLFVDFFGRPASTHKGPALLALQYSAPVVVGYAIREGDGLKYRMGTAAIIDPKQIHSDAQTIRYLTQRVAHALERTIRTAPEQYLWLHRRWKHQPSRRAARRAA